MSIARLGLVYSVVLLVLIPLAATPSYGMQEEEETDPTDRHYAGDVDLRVWALAGGEMHTKPDTEFDYLLGGGVGVITEQVAVTTTALTVRNFVSDEGKVNLGGVDAPAFLDALADFRGLHLDGALEVALPLAGPENASTFPWLMGPETEETYYGVYLRLEASSYFADGEDYFDMLGAIGFYYTLSNATARAEYGLRQKERLYRPYGRQDDLWDFVRLRLDSYEIFGPIGTVAFLLVDVDSLLAPESTGEVCELDGGGLQGCAVVPVGRESRFGIGLAYFLH